MNKWNMDDIKAIVSEVASRKKEYEFLNDMELKYNYHLRNALGRCKCKGIIVNKKVESITPYCIEISKTVLNFESYDMMKQIVLHEVAHALADMKHQDNCQHDYRFKEMCKEIGCTSSGTYATEEERQAITNVKEKTAKYKVSCTNCNHDWYYKTKTKAVKNPSSCYCPYCGHDDFHVTTLR